MSTCRPGNFYGYFRENMEAMGLPAPSSLFGTLSTAIGTASTILSQIDKLGPRVTLGEIIGAASRLEALGVAAAVSASFYAGAVVGSIVIATGRRLSPCGTRLADLLVTAQQQRVYRPWLAALWVRYPGMVDPEAPRQFYARWAARAVA